MRARRPDRGSVLMLLPACVLVVIVLASIAVDMAMVHLRQREALDLAASAANDAVTAGADPARLRAGGFDLDAGAVQATVDRHRRGLARRRGRLPLHRSPARHARRHDGPRHGLGYRGAAVTRAPTSAAKL